MQSVATCCKPPLDGEADELRERAVLVAGHLLERGAKLLVIACNSATSAGADAVRELAAERGVEVVTVVAPEAEIAGAITEPRVVTEMMPGIG